MWKVMILFNKISTFLASFLSCLIFASICIKNTYFDFNICDYPQECVQMSLQVFTKRVNSKQLSFQNLWNSTLCLSFTLSRPVVDQYMSLVNIKHRDWTLYNANFQNRADTNFSLLIYWSILVNIFKKKQ